MTEVLAEARARHWSYAIAHGQGFGSFREEGICTLNPMRNTYVIFFLDKSFHFTCIISGCNILNYCFLLKSFFVLCPFILNYIDI